MRFMCDCADACFGCSIVFICLFVFGCAGSLLRCAGCSCSERGLLSSCSAQASRCSGFSLVVEHGLEGVQSSLIVMHRLSCSVACGIFPNQGSNSYLLHWQADFRVYWTTREIHTLKKGPERCTTIDRVTCREGRVAAAMV